MSSFLWVEDFEGGQYREFSYRIFGHALGLAASDFFDNEIELKSFLKSKQIHLVTNMADGIRFINNEAKFREIDFVVLDIDLALMGVDISEDEDLIKPLLMKWYHYNPKDANEEKSFNTACDELKRVAGYHLYIDLVVNRRFPRDRILFCSNHGGYLKAIQESFSGAKIEPPTVLTKADPILNSSVAYFFSDEYSKLRRSIISICDELATAIPFEHAKFILPQHLRNLSEDFNATDGVYLLKILPLILPPFINERSEKAVIYRQFIRVITQEFDRVDFSSQGKRNLACINVLHSIRNFTSHNSKALNNLDESDVAYIFLLFLLVGFESKEKFYENFKSGLIESVGVSVEINNDDLRVNIANSLEDVLQKSKCLPDEVKSEFDNTSHFKKKVKLLSENQSLASVEYDKLIYRIFWHEIVRVDDSGNVTFSEKNQYLLELMRRIYSKSF